MSGPTLADLVAQLDRLAALRMAATPGPWTNAGPDSPGQWMIYDYQWCVATATPYDHNEVLSNKPGATGPGYIDADANAAFIAAAGSFDFAALRAALAESPARSREEPGLP